MNSPTLAVYCFGYNLDKIRYPWRESLRSALELTRGNGSVYFCACDEETFQTVYRDFLKEIDEDFHLIVLRHIWGDHYSIQAEIANYILGCIGAQQEYAIKLDMDEVLHEASFEDFRQDLAIMHQHDILLGRPEYTHYLTETLCTPFIYQAKAVISKTSSGFRFSLGHGGDACALGGAPEFQTRLKVAHYGKFAVGREKEAIYKEYTFQQLYTDLGFPDPLVVKQYEGQGYADYNEIFHAAKERGEFYECNDPHPIFVQKWLEESRKRSTQFWKERQNA